MLRVWALIWLWVAGCARAFGSEWSYEGATITLANLNISYSDPATGMNRTDVGEVGKFGSGAVGVAAGILIVGHSLDGGDPRHNRHGCKMPWAVVPPNEPWVALVSRGECADREKIANAQALNASAILVYAKDAQEHLQKIALSSFSRERGVVVFLAHQQGEQLARMVENGTKVYVSITRGEDVKYRVTNINRTSVLFVSVSFIILMVISLAWLIFYYIQRFRYIHAKDRLARHLCNAAKKSVIENSSQEFKVWRQGNCDRKRMLRCLHRAISSVRHSQDFALQTRIPQELRRPLAFGAPNMPHVQDGHSEILWIRFKWQRRKCAAT